MTAPASPLERRYRRLLRALPAGYRRAWSEEMVGTFLESMHADDPEQTEFLLEFGHPPRAEVASVLGLAVRLRLGGVNGLGAPPPRYVAWGEAVRRLALLALLSQAVLELVGVVLRLWAAGRLPGLRPPILDGPGPHPQPPWEVALHLVALLWLPAYLALLAGHWRAARVLAGLAVLAPAVRTAESLLAAVSYSGAVAQLVVLAFPVVLVLALAAYHPGAPPVPVRPWLVALVAGTAGMAALTLALMYVPPAAYAFDEAGLWCAVVAVATVVHVVVRARRPADGTDPWPLALALMAAGALAIRLVTLAWYALSPAQDRVTLVTSALAGTVAVVAAGLPMAVLAARSMRRLPAVTDRW